MKRKGICGANGSQPFCAYGLKNKPELALSPAKQAVNKGGIVLAVRNSRANL